MPSGGGSGDGRAVSRDTKRPEATIVTSSHEDSAARRHEVLREMEIDAWTRRAPVDAGAPNADALDWDQLREVVAACTRCELHRTRTQTVFGVGNRRARWLVIGEAPGAEEDRQGEPFVGAAGQLLNEMLRALSISREDVYIANILKCRPPANREPKAEEAAACSGYLDRQITLLAPKLILAAGRIAAVTLLRDNVPLARLRGRIHSYGPAGIPLVATYHPAYLLRSPGEKRKAWDDLRFARRLVDPVVP